jgi:hypothetical protein
MLHVVLASFLSGVFAVPLFHEGTTFLLYENFFWLQGWFGLPDGFRPLSSGFSMRLMPPVGLPELLNLMFWGGMWGLALGTFQRLVRPPALLTGFLFGSLLCTAVGFAPGYGERGLPFWVAGYAPNWLRTALINGAWGWGAAALMQAAAINRRFLH